MIANNDGRFGPAIRDGHLLRVLCDAALEACFLALALQQTCQPQVYRWKDASGNWHARADVDVLSEMWTLASKAAAILMQLGWALRHAQSTWHAKQAGMTRGRTSFSVDVTVKRGGCCF